MSEQEGEQPQTPACGIPLSEHPPFVEPGFSWAEHGPECCVFMEDATGDTANWRHEAKKN